MKVSYCDFCGAKAVSTVSLPGDFSGASDICEACRVEFIVDKTIFDSKWRLKRIKQLEKRD